MATVVADIDMPDDGSSPSISYPRNTLPSRLVFAVVIPPAGSEEDARLFALCPEGRPETTFHTGPRPAALAARCYAIETIDPEMVARLFERGTHPGDLRLIDAPRDRFGRDQTAALTFLDLSQGFAQGDRICTPWEMRLGLAFACAEIGDRQWAAAADVLDPAKLMRDRAIPLPGGNPMTREGFHRYMLDGADRSSRRMDVSHHPMRDFRLLQLDELLEEIVRDARAILYGRPDLPPEGAATDLLKRRVGDFVEAIRSGGDAEAAHGLLRTRFAAISVHSQVSPALRHLQEGHGPGAVCWRNLFAPNGLIETALKLTRSPEARGRQAEAIAKLPHWARRAVLDPSTILAGCPRTLDRARAALGDRHRPFLALPASRLAAAPGLLISLSALPRGHAEALIRNTSLLLAALDEIENLHALLPEARDAVAIGWHAVAKSIVEMNPSRSDALEALAPDFVTERALALPFLSARNAFHRSLGPSGMPTL